MAAGAIKRAHSCPDLFGYGTQSSPTWTVPASVQRRDRRSVGDALDDPSVRTKFQPMNYKGTSITISRSSKTEKHTAAGECKGSLSSRRFSSMHSGGHGEIYKGRYSSRNFSLMDSGGHGEIYKGRYSSRNISSMEYRRHDEDYKWSHNPRQFTDPGNLKGTSIGKSAGEIRGASKQSLLPADYKPIGSNNSRIGFSRRAQRNNSSAQRYPEVVKDGHLCAMRRGELVNASQHVNDFVEILPQSDSSTGLSDVEYYTPERRTSKIVRKVLSFLRNVRPKNRRLNEFHGNRERVPDREL